MFATTVGLALLLAAAAQPRPPLPAAVRAACNAVHAVVEKTPGTKARRSNGTFGDELLRTAVVGCRLDVDGSVKQAGDSQAAPEALRHALEARGWKELPDFSADGHDGTSFAYTDGTAACLARGAWDGGSDDQPDAPAADPYRLTVICGRAADFVRSR